MDSSFTWPSCRAAKKHKGNGELSRNDNSAVSTYLVVSMMQLPLFTAVVNRWPEGTVTGKLGLD